MKQRNISKNYLPNIRDYINKITKRDRKMNLKTLKEKIKGIALESGAKLVGIGSQDRLKDAIEKAPSADMEYCLPNAKSCIIWAYPNSIEALENYFSKKERMSIKKQQYFAYSTGWKTAQKIRDFIENNTDYKAFAVIPNGKYRTEGSFSNIIEKDIANPDFSLRYGAVAAGLGHIGWSGNLVTKEYGGSLYLAGALTTAPLEPDPMAEENHCNKCKICYKACTTGYISSNEEEEPVIIGGYKEIYAKRNKYSRCGIGCAGWTGLSEDGMWSTWTPGHVSLKEVSDDQFTADYKKDLMKKLFSKEIPKHIKKFNLTILNSFAKTAFQENVGLRSLEDTNPRCGNCSFICVADPKKRVELYNLLKSSGKVFLDDQGKEYVKKFDDSGNVIIYYPPKKI
jgi:epoxyqueuosine reductase QueG